MLQLLLSCSPTWGDIGSHSPRELAVPPTAIFSLLPPLEAKPVQSQDGPRPKRIYSFQETQKSQAQVSGSPWLHLTRRKKDTAGTGIHCHSENYEV